MKTPLSEHLRQHRPDFDTAVPPFGHFERFEQRLEQLEQRRHWQSRIWLITTSVAAMIAIILMFQFLYIMPPQPQPTISFQEIAGFYNMQLNEKIDHIKNSLQNLDSQSRQELLNDLTVMLESNKKFNPQNLNTSQENQIAWMIQRYNIQMESLQHIEGLVEKTEY